MFRTEISFCSFLLLFSYAITITTPVVQRRAQRRAHSEDGGDVDDNHYHLS